MAVSCSLPSVPPPAGRARPRARACDARRHVRWTPHTGHIAGIPSVRDESIDESSMQRRSGRFPATLAEADHRAWHAGSILVIEDEPGIVDFLERGLRAHGLRRRVGAATATAGSRLALDDGRRPGRARPDAARAAAGSRCSRRSATRKPGLPVIVLTALGEVERPRRRTGRRARSTTSSSRSRWPSWRRGSGLSCAWPRRRRGRRCVGGDIEVDLLTPRGAPRRRAGPAVDDRVRAARLPDAATAGGCSRASRSCARCGATSTTPERTSSTSTSAICAASSRRRRRRAPPIVTVRSVGYRLRCGGCGA